MSFKVIPLITQQEMERRIGELAHAISTDYREGDLLLLGVLKGAFVFMADLIRKLTIPVSVDFITLSSYPSGTISSGAVEEISRPSLPISGRDLLVVEDIVDTGISLNHLRRTLQEGEPRSLRFCALLDKPSRRQVDVKLDYIGFEVPDKFIVGYGIDYNQSFRSLPYLAYIEFENLPAGQVEKP